MTITEFLEARIAEDEMAANDLMGEREGDRTLAECAAKREIIKQHEEWPVLVEREPSELESVMNGMDSITYRMTREVAWLTEREYVKRFGTEAPTAPMIRTLAAIYAGHADYQQEWAL